MVKNADIRIDRTRVLLTDALVALILDEEKDATRVSVAELTRRAGVNRSTFYLHYVDIFDFLDIESRRVVDGLLDAADKGSGNCSVPGDHYASFFEYVAKNSGFFKAMLGPHGYHGFRAYMESAGRKAYV